MRRVFAFIGLLNLGVLSPLPAQHIGPMFARWEPTTALGEASRAPRADTLPRRYYRYEGLGFGGVVLGAAGVWIGWNVAAACPTVPGARCEPDRLGNAIVAGLVGAAFGGGLGYLVGGLTSKPYPNQLPAAEPLGAPLLPDSTRRLVGYQHWKGAAIGAGSGALLGTLLVILAKGNCSDCNGPAGDGLRTSLLGGTLGGAFGFLVGLASPKYE
jgi:hypothetical protein